MSAPGVVWIKCEDGLRGIRGSQNHILSFLCWTIRDLLLFRSFCLSFTFSSLNVLEREELALTSSAAALSPVLAQTPSGGWGSPWLQSPADPFSTAMAVPPTSSSCVATCLSRVRHYTHYDHNNNRTVQPLSVAARRRLRIDPGTVRLIAQRLNHYATPGP
jgi:hypothetical protein